MRKQVFVPWKVLIVYLKFYSLLLTYTQASSQNATFPAKNSNNYYSQTKTTFDIQNTPSKAENSSIKFSASSKLALTSQFTPSRPLIKSPIESSTRIPTGSESSATYEPNTRSTRAISHLKLLISRKSTLPVSSTPNQRSASTSAFSGSTLKSVLSTNLYQTPSLTPSKRASTSTSGTSDTAQNKTSPIKNPGPISSDISGHLTSQQPEISQNIITRSPNLTQSPLHNFSTTQGRYATKRSETSLSTRNLELDVTASSISTEEQHVKQFDFQPSALPTLKETKTASLQASTTAETSTEYDSNSTTVTGRFNNIQSASERQGRFGTCQIVILLLVLIGVALTAGGIIFVGKQCYEKWGKGDYNQLDFLVNGMYN